MAEYSPSKIIKDGNTYNFRDDTKIPLAGSNAISGDLIPATTDTVNLGSSTKEYNNAYIKSLTINGVACGDILTHNVSEFVPRSGGAVFENYIYSRSVNNDVLRFAGGTTWANGAGLALFGKDRTSDAGVTFLKADNGTSFNQIALYPNGMFTQNVNETVKHIAMQEDVIPRSGGAVMTGGALGRASNNSGLALYGGQGLAGGAMIAIYGKYESNRGGAVLLYPNSGSVGKNMFLWHNGTWTWEGTACQITSDQRYKQQITEIDDKLLDAWQDVDLVQFKYNDAVDQKGNTARLHTGYVVQQIDSACKEHGVDISAYGLYCHEEYPGETEEVEVENEDGTKTKERKVIREASEHYSLRYTEALIVECAYLRKCIKELRNEIEELKSSK